MMEQIENTAFPFRRLRWNKLHGNGSTWEFRTFYEFIKL